PAGEDEESTEQEADSATEDSRLDDQRDPEDEQHRREGERRAGAHRSAHAARRPAARSTRQGLALRTWSTVGPKIAVRRRAGRRGAPMTMSSAVRRSASSTIAGPARLARTSRVTARTP